MKFRRGKGSPRDRSAGLQAPNQWSNRWSCGRGSATRAPVFRGSQQVPQRRTDALFSRLSRPDEHLAPQRRLGSLGRPTQRPLKHSHLKKHTAVARATAGKVLASRYRHDTDVYFSVYSRGTASPAFLVNLFRTRKVPLYLTLEGHKPGSLYLYRLTREFNTM